MSWRKQWRKSIERSSRHWPGRQIERRAWRSLSTRHAAAIVGSQIGLEFGACCFHCVPVGLALARYYSYNRPGLARRLFVLAPLFGTSSGRLSKQVSEARAAASSVSGRPFRHSISAPRTGCGGRLSSVIISGTVRVELQCSADRSGSERFRGIPSAIRF